MHLIRLVIVGDSEVGKTSLLLRFQDDTYDVVQQSTIGVDYKAKTIKLNDKDVKLQIWDTAGQERFRAMTSAFYHRANGVLVTFDVSNKITFNNLSKWIQDIKMNAPDNVVVVICANKTDKPIESWAISRNEFESFANSHNYKIVEVSAATGHNVEKLFKDISTVILSENKNDLTLLSDNITENKNERTNSILLKEVNKPIDKKCC